ncbi:CG31105 [Drosophila busckii]|uniref:CG31105 n=1 Tax=Drosophila busckii TaxID=30019 RepID=A0A0M5J0J4_DROBS|nr:sodium channel protein Nach [Drosophila busckii]ALC47831.1 CG31105 [Drosophila busckii]
MVNIESTSNAIWWIKNPNADRKRRSAERGRARKESLGSSFCLDMAVLVRHVSLQGYDKLLAPELTLLERLIWLLVHMATLVGLLVILSLTWENFVAQYFVINLKDPLYPIENVPFPAVSICANNRISLQAVNDYALLLQSNDPTPRELEYYTNQLRYLGLLYDINNSNFDVDQYMAFQAFLELFGTWDNETFFNTRRVMKLLTPSCENFILKCSLASAEISCFSEDAFQNSLTKYGPCCTFNTKNKLKKRSFKNRLANSELGLSVIINASDADNFAPVLNTNGYIVMVHDADNYATVSSSGALEMFPGHKEESFLKINARVIDTDPSLHSFSPERRGCYFQGEFEMPKNARADTHAAYSFPNCITRCRIRSVIALCNCLPFQYPMELVESFDGVVFCTTSHVSCLRQYQFKWSNVLTQRIRLVGMEREAEEALFCPTCMPACYDIQYKVSLSALPIDNLLASLGNDTELNTNISLLRVYFGQPSAPLYMRLLSNEWYEIFSTVGNILSVFIGFSMVAIFESLFILCKYIFKSCRQLIRQTSADDKAKAMKSSKLTIYP